jgi:hypothetical protein
VLLDVRVDAPVQQGDAGGVPGEPERGPFDDAGVHGDAPFDGQAEPELWLCAKGAAVPPDLAGTGTVDRPERPAERLGGAVSVPDGDAQQITLTPHDLAGGHRHATPAHVLRQRQTGQRREHPAQVVLRQAERTGQLAEVELVGEVLFDQVDQPVQGRDHGASLRDRSCRGAARRRPISADRSDHASGARRTGAAS